MGEQSVRMDLTPEEVDQLREVLTEYVSDLRMQIANTDSMDMREELKRREEVLKSLVRRLSS